ncbi:NfeD family protein [Sphingomonas sp. MA1305]|uniref:NfeD family protein n=1 Tax=Sphingomonas sp. MA1305 TaxID=2479204 RepID=UPI0018DFEF6C|nr:NfeD family protein [Sphingomonas sp. MA1305]
MNLDSIGGAAGAWLIVALALGIAELLIPGVFAVFIAVAAAVVGLTLFVLPGLPVAAQIGAFAVWSAVSVLIGRRWYRDYPVATSDPQLNDRAARLIGQIVVAETAIDRDGGRVRIGDGSWPARGVAVAAGERLRVAQVDGGVVIVERIAD